MSLGIWMLKWKVNHKGESDFKILHASHAWLEGNFQFQDLITKQDLSPKLLGSQAWSRRDRWWRRSWAEDSTYSAGSTWTPCKEVKCKTKTRWRPDVEGVLRSQVEHPAQVDVVQLGLVRVHLNSVIIIFSLSVEINLRKCFTSEWQACVPHRAGRLLRLLCIFQGLAVLT